MEKIRKTVSRSSEEMWEAFLRRYYWEKILDLAGNYPEERSLLVDFRKLENWDSEVADELLEVPDVVLKHANEALHSSDVPTFVDFSEACVRIVNLPKPVPIKEIRSSEIGKLISISGLIKKVTEVRPKLDVAAFECRKCHFVTRVFQSERFTEPLECENEDCGRRAGFKLDEELSEFVDFQKVRIQDSPDEIRPGEQPQTLDAIARSDLTGKVYPGDKATLVGILRSYQRFGAQGKSTTFDYSLEVISIEVVDKGFEEVEITKEDVTKIKEMSSDPDIYKKITGSIAPSIYGYAEVKEALALQLFSGLTKELPDGLRVRGDIHILLMGDPGVAKSQCLRYVKKLAPRGVFASGKGSTAAGLTATAVKDNDFSDGRWTLEAGALVLADMGIVCADEFEKMTPEDRSSMHDAMEQQLIEVHKAGINTTLKSRCSVLAAANPKYGRFDKYEPVSKQINLPVALLSRFDLIFVVLDEPIESRDKAISDHIFGTHVAGEKALCRQKVKDAGITEEEVTSAMSNIQPLIDAEMLRKYIAYAKKSTFPVLQPEAEKRLKQFYLGLRKLGVDPNVPLPVTARQEEALIRLGEASARTRLSNRVTAEDAERVVRIVMASLNQAYKDPQTGELDSDIINVGMGKSQRERIKMILQAIRTLQSNGNDVPLDLIVQTLGEEGLTKEVVEESIRKLKTAGDLIETGAERYRVVA